jgi:hypothetical protein
MIENERYGIVMHWGIFSDETVLLIIIAVVVGFFLWGLFSFTSLAPQRTLPQKTTSCNVLVTAMAMFIMLPIALLSSIKGVKK